MNDTLIAIETVVARTGMSRATIYRMIAAKSFPRPVKIGGASRWSETEVSAWIDQRKAARGAA